MFQYQTKTRDLYYDKAIDLYVREGLSYRQIAKILPVSKTTIMRWIAIYSYGFSKCFGKKLDYRSSLRFSGVFCGYILRS